MSLSLVLLREINSLMDFSLLVWYWEELFIKYLICQKKNNYFKTICMLKKYAVRAVHILFANLKLSKVLWHRTKIIFVKCHYLGPAGKEEKWENDIMTLVHSHWTMIFQIKIWQLGQCSSLLFNDSSTQKAQTVKVVLHLP